MPWSGSSFASRHNHKLKGAAADKAAAQATAMVKSGAPEGVAIATANKTAKKGWMKADRKAEPPTRKLSYPRTKKD